LRRLAATNFPLGKPKLADDRPKKKTAEKIALLHWPWRLCGGFTQITSQQVGSVQSLEPTAPLARA
jgi:hypothetical protein